MAALESGRIVQRAQLVCYGTGNLLASMAGGHAPQAGSGIQQGAVVYAGVIVAFRSLEQARHAFELAVRSERKPVMI